jgi:adenylosuccinate lyase
MDTRYSHPDATELWSLRWTYAAWLTIETRTLVAQRECGVVPKNDETDYLVDELLGRLHEHVHVTADDIDVDDILAFEGGSRHDVVAFLDWLRTDVEDEAGRGPGRWIHFGLTSSDVVDTAQGMRFRQMQPILLGKLGKVISQLNSRIDDRTPVIGRTHGQVAEPMDMGARAWGWLGLLSPAASDLSRITSRMAVCKLSGPVGTFAHNPPEVENAVARDLHLRPLGAGATQIAPRSSLAAWAAAASNVVQVCAKIAHDMRLMILLGEAEIVNKPDQVGSSSMAHKVNPVEHERMAGMARMAQGYALMLSDLGTWLERDISMSCVERVAVPDLWHVVLHTLETTGQLLSELKVNRVAIPPETLVSRSTLFRIEGGESVEEARAAATKVADQRHTVIEGYDVAFAMRNYPRNAR